MSLLNTAYRGIAATNNMTAFSYLLSELTGCNFKEAALLRELLEEYDVEEENAELIAWAGHYAVGIVFAAACDIAWKDKEKVSIVDGLLPGAGFGILAILVWREILNRHPLSLHTKRNDYYMQLFIAHLIFGLTLAAHHKKE